MGDLLTEFLVMGKVPGTEATINFEAFLEGMLSGAIVLLVFRLFVIRRLKKTN